MSLDNTRPEVAYGLSSALINTPSLPIVSVRSPTAQDKAPIGQEWVNKLTNQIYFLTSIVNNASTWVLVEVGGGAGVFNSVTSATFVTAGTTITAGTGITSTLGDITASAGNIIAAGTVTGGTGVTATTGNIAASAGNITASGTVTGGTGLIATTGNITASGTTAVISAPGASASITTGGTITAQGGITSNIGNITATAGSIQAGTVLRAAGDIAGVASTTQISNVVDTTQGAGFLTIRSTTANSADNTGGGFIKIYVGTTAMFIPYFTAADIAP
jgi:hypothetical protein